MAAPVPVIAAFSRWIACLLLCACSSAFAAEPEIKVAVEKTGDAFVVDADVDLPFPIRTVWDVLTDFDNMAAIVTTLTSSRISRRKGDSLTVQQEGTAKFGMLSYSFSSERKIRLEPLKRILTRQISGQAKRFESQADLAETSTGTSVHYHAEIEPDSILARMFGATFIRHEVEEQFHAMAGEMARRQRLI